MVLFGMFNIDWLIYVMCWFFENLGYDVWGWGLGCNFINCMIGIDGECLFDVVVVMYEEIGEFVMLIGVSLGGIMVCLVVYCYFEMICEVIIVVFFYVGDLCVINVWWVFEMLIGDKIDSDVVIVCRLEIVVFLLVVVIVIWSCSDGFVNGMICCNFEEFGCCVIEVCSSYVGV